VYDAPLAISEPPVAAAYQSMVHPLGAVAAKTALLVPQYALLLGLLGAAGSSPIVTVFHIGIDIPQQLLLTISFIL